MILTIFGSPVVVLKIDNFKELFTDEHYEEMVRYLTSNKNQFEKNSYVRGGETVTTTLRGDTIDQLGSLYDCLRQEGLKYSHLFLENPVKNLKLYTSTVNLSFQGSEIKNHSDIRHDGNEKSLTILFYPKVPKESANLVFIHSSKYSEWVSDRDETDLIRLNVEEGNIVIFDNFLLHAVGTHNSVNPRMSIHSEFDFIID